MPPRRQDAAGLCRQHRQVWLEKALFAACDMQSKIPPRAFGGAHIRHHGTAKASHPYKSIISVKKVITK